MNTKTIVLILLRRWYVVIPIAAAALFFALQSGGSPTHSVETSFLLVTTPDVSGSTEDASANPILTTPSEVGSVANVVAVTMHGESRRTEVWEAGYSTSYDFFVARNDPFVVLTVWDDTAEGAVESSIVLTQLFVEEMTEQQIRFGADPGALVRAELLEISEPIADYSSVRTTQAMVAFIGLVFAVVAAFAVEGVVYFFSDQRREYRAMQFEAASAVDQAAVQPQPQRIAPQREAHQPELASVETAPELEPAESASASSAASRGSRWGRS